MHITRTFLLAVSKNRTKKKGNECVLKSYLLTSEKRPNKSVTTRDVGNQNFKLYRDRTEKPRSRTALIIGVNPFKPVIVVNVVTFDSSFESSFYKICKVTLPFPQKVRGVTYPGNLETASPVPSPSLSHPLR